MSSTISVRTAVPTVAPQAPAEDPLLMAAERLDEQARALESEPGRLPLWQLLHAGVQAAQVARTHARACASPAGELAELCERDPALCSAVAAVWDEHDRMSKLANQLVAAANATTEPDLCAARTLRQKAEQLGRRLRAHRSLVTHVLIDGTLRETGGEG